MLENSYQSFKMFKSQWLAIIDEHRSSLGSRQASHNFSAIEFLSLNFSISCVFPVFFQKILIPCVFPIWNYFSLFSLFPLFSLWSGNPVLVNKYFSEERLGVSKIPPVSIEGDRQSKKIYKSTDWRSILFLSFQIQSFFYSTFLSMFILPVTIFI